MTPAGIIMAQQIYSQSHNLKTVLIRALPVPEIEALSLTKLHTSGGRRNM